MENSVQLIENEEFGKIRTVIIDDEIWFVAADVCRVLGLKNVTRALSKLDEDEKSKIDENRITTDPNYYEGSTVTPFLHEINLVNESGLYSLVFMSRKPNAKKFRKWVTGEVLPSIRKYGYYRVENFDGKFRHPTDKEINEFITRMVEIEEKYPNCDYEVDSITIEYDEEGKCYQVYHLKFIPNE